MFLLAWTYSIDLFSKYLVIGSTSPQTIWLKYLKCKILFRPFPNFVFFLLFLGRLWRNGYPMHIVVLPMQENINLEDLQVGDSTWIQNFGVNCGATLLFWDPLAQSINLAKLMTRLPIANIENWPLWYMMHPSCSNITYSILRCCYNSRRY